MSKRKNMLFLDNKPQIETMHTLSDVISNDIILDLNEKIEKLNLDILRLTDENFKLNAQLSAYELVDKCDNNETLTELSNKINELKNANLSLRDENDTYLMKISDLTFDNAKLNAQIQELLQTQLANTTDVLSSKKIINHQSTNVSYYNPYKNNGYNDWN